MIQSDIRVECDYKNVGLSLTEDLQGLVLLLFEDMNVNKFLLFLYFRGALQLIVLKATRFQYEVQVVIPVTLLNNKHPVQ
jgi:hypothetical protein